MDHRLGRTVRVFLVVLAAAGFYRLAVVPWVEPRVRDVQASMALSPEQAAAIRARADRRLAALGEVFPEGSWEREDPIMLESRQMRLLFKEYHTLPDGRVNLVPCTLVVLPDRNRSAASSTGRTLVLRAPRGAVLEFDEPLDLKQGRLAKLVGGSLRGQVTIRGLPTTPTAEDDIEIVTRDLELDELQVQTVETVQFRYGRSTGSGRGLVVRLTPRQGPEGQGPNVGGVESVRIDRDVRMRLEGLAGGLVPGRTAPPAAAQPGDAAPVLVSCRGSLCLNVAADVITLEDTVEVVRTGTQAGTDHLACDLLAILLGRRDRPVAAVGDAHEADAGRGPLEPTEIQAKGTPVVATSAQAGLEARAARLGYEIATRRIVLDGDDPVSLVVKTTAMEARKIDYCPGAAGGPGALMAVGPGQLTSRPERGQPARARWQQWLRMRPDGAGHVASLAGDAEVTVEGQGRLAASELHLWLDVVADEAPAGQPADGPDLSRFRPARLLARGMVETDAEQIEARTDRLEVWFRSVAAPAAPPAQGAAAQNATAAPASGAAAVAPPRPQPPAERPRAAGRIAATAALVRGLVTMGPAGNQLEEMSMEGQVRLVEQPAAAVVPGAPPAEPGLEVLGDQMQVSRAAGPDARAIVSGRPARVRGRGLDLTGPLVEFDRGRGRITVDGAGQLAVPVAGDAAGLDLMGFSAAAPPRAAPAGRPGRLDVVWQGRMDFDGRTARFVDRVVTTSGDTAVKAGSLDVVFDKPFDFGGAPRPGAAQPEVMQVACGGGVHVENESQAEDGGRSRDRLHVRDLVVDRVTGDVSGTGPGRLTSTRLGQAALPAVGGAVQPVAAPRPAAGLTYLGVDFQRGLRGNIHRRRMEFHQRVEAVWGPVTGWDDALDPHAPAGLPEGVVAVSCDVLGVGQVPPAAGGARPSMELAAGGNVLVEGESFTARSARLTWAEAKDLLVFEGDGRADAQLFRQLQAGAQPSSASAGKILYWRGLNRVDVEDARYLDLDQIRGGAAPNLPGPRGGGPTAAPPTRSLPGT